MTWIRSLRSEPENSILRLFQYPVLKVPPCPYLGRSEAKLLASSFPLPFEAAIEYITHLLGPSQ